MSKVEKAEKFLLAVAIKYGYSMTRTAASEHAPKEVPFRMSLARAYLTYEKAKNARRRELKLRVNQERR